VKQIAIGGILYYRLMAAGPVIAGGMLLVNSGYALNGGIAGNVLLVR
jgi:hypothetical protein